MPGVMLGAGATILKSYGADEAYTHIRLSYALTVYMNVISIVMREELRYNRITLLGHLVETS